MDASNLYTTDGVTVVRQQKTWPTWMGSGGGTVMLNEIIMDLWSTGLTTKIFIMKELHESCGIQIVTLQFYYACFEQTIIYKQTDLISVTWHEGRLNQIALKQLMSSSQIRTSSIRQVTDRWRRAQGFILQNANGIKISSTGDESYSYTGKNTHLVDVCNIKIVISIYIC